MMKKTLRFLLRFRYFSRLKDKRHSSHLGKFSISWSEQQAQATDRLLDHLTGADGQDGNEVVLHSYVHDLLVSLVHHSIRGTSKMECPTDQSLFLLSLRFSPEGALQFQTANRLTHDCAVLQYWFFVIVTHVARLEAGSHGTFIFYSSEELVAESEHSRYLSADEETAAATLPDSSHGSGDYEEIEEAENDDQELEEELEQEWSAAVEGGEHSNILR